MNYEPLVPAQPVLNQHGVATHPEYGDVYHSLSGAMGQADYVFLAGNDLPNRWRGRAQFTICETGFGLGNNFLTTWYRWQQDPERSRTLHFVSFEAHPLTQQDLQAQLERSDPQLQPFARQLIQKWPALLPGVHRLEFAHGAVSLTLVFGRIEHTAAQVELCADAFFLDGFSPRLNPAMWTPAVWSQLVRMAAQGATLATWCTASAVRRDLQNAGFILQKRPGYAFKREMLTGQLRSHLGQRERKQPPQTVAVIGAGIVGASLAYALAQRQIQVHVYDPVMGRGTSGLDLGGRHAGHDAVAMVPMIARADPPRARLSRLGIALARQRWRPWLGDAWFCGSAITAAKNVEEAEFFNTTVQRLAFDPNWVRWHEAKEPVIGGVSLPYGGLLFTEAYTVRPAELIRHLLAAAPITAIAAEVVEIQATAQGWQLFTATEKSVEYEAVIVANAGGAQRLLKTWVDKHQYPRFWQAGTVQGQVGSYPASCSSWPYTGIMNGPGYILNDRQGQIVLGSTYDREDSSHIWSHARQATIEARLRPFLSTHMPTVQATSGWVGERLAMRDHRPVIDVVHAHAHGLWIATAMGSHGFSWASVAAEQIAAQLCQEPPVLTLDLKRSVALR